VSTVLSLWILILQRTACDTLNFLSALLKLVSHQRVENSNDCEWQEVVDDGFDYCDVSVDRIRLKFQSKLDDSIDLTSCMFSRNCRMDCNILCSLCL
jgi:hypothetical protein